MPREEVKLSLGNGAAFVKNLWCVVAVGPHSGWVAAAQLPYFVWVSIATVLQLSITAMNG